MSSKDLTYKIGVDASDAASGLRKLEQSVRQTMRTVEDELDESSTAGDKLAASLDKVAAQAKEDFASATIAAERMGQALKDAGSDLNVADVLPTLQRMGLSMDEITQEADRLAASLKQLDDVRATGVKDLDSVAPGLSAKLNDVSKSADSSKGALANMIGNSAQDLGELGGIAGSAGVAVGQMAEYFADAAFEGEGLGSVLKSFAGVAAPIAAIALATKAATDVMGRFSASQDRTTESVEMWEDALREGSDASEAYADSLREVGEVTLDLTRSQSDLANVSAELDSHWYSTGIGVKLLTNLLGASKDETKDMTSALADAGLTVERWTELVAGGATEQELLADALKRTNLSEDEQKDVLETLSQAQQDHAKAAENDAVMTAFFGDAAAEAAPSAEELAAEAEELRQKQEEAARAAREHAIAITDANKALLEATTTFAEMGRRGEALSAIFDLGSAPLEAASSTRDIAAAIDELDEAAKDVDLSKALDPANLGADKLLDAFDSLRPQIQAKITEAFSTGGPEAASQVANDYVAAIVEQLGGKLSPEEVIQLLGIGDLTANLQVALDMSTAARVRTQLEILTGVAGTSPLTASIALALEAGTITPEAAEVLVRAQLGQAKVALPTDVTPPSAAAVAEAGAFVTAMAQSNPGTIPLEGDTGPAEDAAAGFAASDLEPATVPLDADPAKADTETTGFRRRTEATKPVVTVDADTKTAIATMLYLKILSALLAPTVTVRADTSPAISSIYAAASIRPTVPIVAYLSDYPSSTEIAGRIGAVRVPVDAYIRTTPRLTGLYAE